MRTAVIFDNFGPYHWARLRAAAHVCELTAIQVSGHSAEYAWKNAGPPDNFPYHTLFPHTTSTTVEPRDLGKKMAQTLADACPQVVCVPGWSTPAAFAALAWCIRHHVPVTIMSESTAWDEHRVWWKEWVKRQLLGLGDTAVVGGRSHQEYLGQLGLAAERIFLGYDAVDNGYFADEAEKVRRQQEVGRRKLALPQHFFLASARFIPKKNLARLLKAYARYRELAQISDLQSLTPDLGPPLSVFRSPSSVPSPIPSASHPSTSAPPLPSDFLRPWDLVLLGDGPLRDSLRSQVSTLNLADSVHFPGFQQYPELPTYYGLADAFIHASTTEQWGLVVNEAMASGLPVLVSNRCGCARDLVQEGHNGFTFNPYQVEELARLMFHLTTSRLRLAAYGFASQQIVQTWSPEKFARNLLTACECAITHHRPKRNPVARYLLKLLTQLPPTAHQRTDDGSAHAPKLPFKPAVQTGKETISK